MDDNLCLIQILANEGYITEEEQAILIQLYLNGELNAPKYNNLNYKQNLCRKNIQLIWLQVYQRPKTSTRNT